jgi:hypothetical protein
MECVEELTTQVYVGRCLQTRMAHDLEFYRCLEFCTPRACNAFLDFDLTRCKDVVAERGF